jgi:hypothetical protein
VVEFPLPSLQSSLASHNTVDFFKFVYGQQKHQHGLVHRIPGGIGAVLPWIPIKAYRPCPNLLDKGGTYERAGQGLDEIAFGRGDSNVP